MIGSANIAIISGSPAGVGTTVPDPQTGGSRLMLPEPNLFEAAREVKPPVEYRPVAGFPAYRVGSDGTVSSCWSRGGRRRVLTDKWHIKVPDVGDKGHLRVELRDESGTVAKFMVHRLVLEAFVGPCPAGMEGCHGDGDPTNNRITNLRWDTPENNWADRKRHGRGCEGTKSSQAKLDDEAVQVIRDERARGVPLKNLAARFGVSMAKISQVALGQNWRHVNGRGY